MTSTPSHCRNAVLMPLRPSHRPDSPDARSGKKVLLQHSSNQRRSSGFEDPIAYDLTDSIHQFLAKRLTIRQAVRAMTSAPVFLKRLQRFHDRRHHSLSVLPPAIVRETLAQDAVVDVEIGHDE
ncbi:hypothetical protein LTR28_002085 [Elasticomyces elasticus]|nr:hypothetical protein LTR28_002085 [Elasticomyces elasticus]